MASPNIKADKSVKIRRRNTLPGPLHKIRQQSALLQKRRTNGGCGSSSAVANHRIISSPEVPTGRWHHLHQSKTNPYVGWFSHAPSLSSCVPQISLPSIATSTFASVDTLWLRDWLEETKFIQRTKRNSTKDHSFLQFQYQHQNLKSIVRHMKQKILDRQGSDCKRDLNLDMLLFYKQRHSGHLRGGGTENDLLDDTTVKQYLQNQYAKSNESITIKALSRIACWILDVPLYLTESSDISCKASDLNNIEDVKSIVSNEDDDDESRSDYSYDNHDTLSGSRYRMNRQSDFLNDDNNDESYHEGRGLSSQAEAYYALGAVYRHIIAESTINRNEITTSGHSANDAQNDASDRLDYEITQMDIVRMNRIASRHLDVESIVRLPILTYELKNASRSNKKDAIGVIATIPEEREDTVSCSEYRDMENVTMQTKNDAESSWMIVPHIALDGSFDTSGEQSSSGENTSIGIQNTEVAPDVEHDVCVICLDRFIPGDRIRVLPCKHSFHVGCIDRWLSGSHSFYDCYTAGCPTCKIRPDVNAIDSTVEASSSLFNDFPSRLNESDGSVPSWALARIGHILSQSSQM